MSASAEQPERLAEILREILALSKPMSAKDLRSLQTDSTELLDGQRVDGVDESGSPGGKEAHKDCKES
jgi:hypothetical protein